MYTVTGSKVNSLSTLTKLSIYCYQQIITKYKRKKNTNNKVTDNGYTYIAFLTFIFNLRKWKLIFEV